MVESQANIVVGMTGTHRASFQFKDTRKPFTFPALLQCAYQLADALRYLHDDAVPG